MKTVLVTGASTGIGYATAKRLAERGFGVLAGVRRPEDGARVEAAAAGIEHVILDVTDAESVAALPSALAGRELAGLVNNAGIGAFGALESLSLEDWRRQLDVNVLGLVDVTRAALPALRAAHGRIVNVGSIGGRMGLPFFGPYNASKFAVAGLTDSLRQELRPFGVHVVLIEPGSIRTEIWNKGLSEADEQLASLSDEHRALYGSRMRRFATLAEKTGKRGIPPEQVAEAILKALVTARPRTRYLVGADAKAQARARALLGARALDRAGDLQLRLSKPR